MKKHVGLPISDETLKDLDGFLSDPSFKIFPTISTTSSSHMSRPLYDFAPINMNPVDGEQHITSTGKKFMWCEPDGNWIEI